ncbi:MAG: ATP-dependent Clp protease ATP-binding subunit ClpX, partial [Pirellulales bacterium]
MDTTNILFICGGTFVGLEKIIGKRLGRRTIGFGQESGIRTESDLTTTLPQVTSDDILEFGLIPELVGRLPVHSALTPLDTGALVRVLTEPKNALIKQYEKLFEMEGAKLHFSDEALVAIAEKAHQRETGARGLRAIIEQVMLDIMFELPEQESGGNYVINDTMVNGQAQMFPVEEPKQKSA